MGTKVRLFLLKPVTVKVKKVKSCLIFIQLLPQAPVP